MDVDVLVRTVEPVTDPYAQSLAALFAVQVARHPDRPAVSGPDRQYSYAELDVLARTFASGLRNLGVPRGAVVAVSGRRGPDACVALLGAAFAGVSYLPLDASLPAERLEGMLADSGAAAVVRLPASFLAVGPSSRVLDFTEILEAADAADSAATDSAATSDSAATRSGPGGGTGAGARPALPGPAEAAAVPAYVMFTSGTTGRPKAVPVPQRGVARLAIDNGFLAVRPTDRVLHASTLSFDASTLEIWPTLLNGACLVPADSTLLLSPPALHAFLRRERITVLFLTTSVFHQMARERPQMFAGLRYVLTGGEVLQPEAARRVLERGRPEHLVNAYGPTEAACVATAHEITEVPQDAIRVPIGVPIADTRCHLLREDGSPAAVGEEGELYIGGPVATGYLNAPRESAERFVTLPLGPDGEDQPVYRSGDFACRGADGCLEFRGRRDEQVKVRGFRIEPAEIRIALTGHPGVADAAVLTREDGATRSLAAWAATGGAPGPAPSPQELLSFLRDRLPGPMVPGTVTVLDRLPLTASGKLDRAALAALGEPPSVAVPPAGGHTTAAVPGAVAAAWTATLSTGRAEPEDDFFEVGGNSLLAVMLVAQVQEALGIDDERNLHLITELLNEPTLRAFTAVVAEVVRAGGPGSGPAARSGATDDGTDRWRPDLQWDIPRVTHADPAPDWRAPRQVLLTGATGFLGSYLLGELLERTDAQIHTLVRARDAGHARERLAEAQTRYGCGRALPEQRVRPLLGDLARPRLGLSDADWEQQAAAADVVHHCGAEVNFLYPYEKLRAANVHGTQEVLRLAARRAVPVHHVSTLAVVHGLGAAGVRRVTESTPLDGVELLAMGYPESKWVAEEVVRSAARAGLPVAVHRPYEVSGATTDHVWNSGAALCELFRIIVELGLAPDLDLALNLVPVDFVAGAIVDLALCRPAEGQTYHLVNPREAVLGDMVDRLRAHGHRIRTVDYPSWTGALLDHLADRPGHRFAPLTRLFTQRIAPGGITVQELARVSVSPRLDRSRLEADLAGRGIDCPPVDQQLLDRYIGYFHASGFITEPAAAAPGVGHA
ncbi:non-ribosomal peptide synthetase [Streptacidiphilus carbonis]|uniref:non-ribosomal peptide synthetase n=1 Tax=Streptacidiphilus carbonis TaxID=105422 RepID=UPI0006943022|nr:amino acid adenylation domain-containing protein [Streptacidiphilus carbonis]